MNWVAPITSPQLVEDFAKELLNKKECYYLIFKIGINTGAALTDILDMKAGTFRGRDRLV